jgi:hypothetical protein
MPEGRQTQRCGTVCSRSVPPVFTEHGLMMLCSVPCSDRAATFKTEVMHEIMHPFVPLWRFLASRQNPTRHLADLAGKADAQVRVVFDAIRNLVKPRRTAPPPRRRIGFAVQEGE